MRPKDINILFYSVITTGLFVLGACSEGENPTELYDEDGDGCVSEDYDASPGEDVCVDCDDGDSAINPNAAEICDGVDNNCDGVVDEGFDADSDGYTSCVDDCDDTDPAIHPEADELIDGVDNDCDGLIDTVTWSRSFEGNGEEGGMSVDLTTDGGYVVAGWTKSFGEGDDDFWLVKIDAQGNEEWNQVFGGSGYEEAHSVQQTGDGGYIVAGFTSSYGAGSHDVWLIKTDGSGQEEWNQTFGGEDHDLAHAVRQTQDGGFIIAGSTSSFGLNDDQDYRVSGV